MDQDIKKIKPYVNNLRKHLKALEPYIKKITEKRIDEQLLEESSERTKLDISNTFAYVLNSLFFSYGKIAGLSTDEMAAIRVELERVQEYMKKSKNFDNVLQKREKDSLQDQNMVKRNIMRALNNNGDSSPTISTKNFQGKHTKFSDDANKDKIDENEKPTQYNSNLVDEITERIKQNKSQTKNKGKISNNKKTQKGGKVSKKK